MTPCDPPKSPVNPLQPPLLPEPPVRRDAVQGCFDEFNRIDVAVLSVVAVQIMTIQAALREEKKEFLFEERRLSGCLKSCAGALRGLTALPVLE